jgi:hypothetical protein
MGKLKKVMQSPCDENYQSLENDSIESKGHSTASKFEKSSSSSSCFLMKDSNNSRKRKRNINKTAVLNGEYSYILVTFDFACLAND